MWLYFFFAKYPSDGHVENRWEKGQHGRKRKRLDRRPAGSSWCETVGAGTEGVQQGQTDDSGAKRLLGAALALKKSEESET